VTDTSSQPEQSAAPNLVAIWRDMVTSEWTKLRSVRSTFWTLLVAAITAIGGSVILAISSAHGTKQPLDPIASIYFAWLEYPVLAVGILGVLVFTSEFSTGQIRTTFTAVPHRSRVLWGKAVVVGTLALVFGEVLSFAAFFLSQAILSSHHRSLSLAHPGVLRAVLAAGICLCAITLVGVALGLIIRHTAGAVAALPALLYLPLVVMSLPSPWNDRIARFTMLMASYQTVSLHRHAGLFSPTISIVIVLVWPTVAMGVAAMLARRDV
jgi:ABC-2 type transport system permease protein